MLTMVMTVRLYAPWAHSLKDKRSEVKSLISKLRQKFNVSVIEADDQDVHQMIVLGIAALAFSNAQSDSIKESVLRFIEENSDAEIASVVSENR